jgi:ABC-type sugar transport system ATPase subunit
VSNPLVAKVEDSTKRLTGAGPLDTAEDVARDVALPFQEGKSIDCVALGIDGAALAFDVAGAMADPLGTLASSAVGWVIENVDFVRKPFDDLAGDPPVIEAAATTWENIAERLAETRQAYASDVRKTARWTGPAADAYLGRASELIETVHLGGFGSKRPHQLSGGMRQRGALARALAQDADILLMDEPFGALDAMTRDTLHEELEALVSTRRTTVLFVTHNVREAARLGDRIVVMSPRPGRVTASIEVDIERPRRIDSAEVSALARSVTDTMREEVLAHARR